MADVFYNVDRDLTIANKLQHSLKDGEWTDLAELNRALQRVDDGRRFESRQARQEARQAKREAEEAASADDALMRAAEELGIDLSSV